MNNINKILSLLKCPYCDSSISIIKYKNRFGSCACSCSIYPIAEDILFMKRNEFLTYKKMLLAIDKGHFLNSIWISLHEFKRKQKIVIFLYYLLFTNGNHWIVKKYLLPSIKLVSPEKTWYTYIEKRFTLPEIHKAIEIILKINPKVIADIGSGLGQLFLLINPRKTYISIEKSFVFLLLGKMLYQNIHPLAICSDIEHGLPLKENSIDMTIFLDCFSLIENKKNALVNSNKVLKKDASIVVINTNEESSETNFWGYGVSIEMIKTWLKSKYVKINFFDLHNNKNKKEIDHLAYSFIANKK